MSETNRTNFGMLYEQDSDVDIMVAQHISEDLYGRYMNRRVHALSLDTVCDTMELAKRLKLDDEKTWNYIRNSPYIYGQNYAFIEDTIDYIYGKKRTVPINTWMKLIDISPEFNPTAKQVVYRKMPSVYNKNILMLWIKRVEGLTDMILFLYTILLETKKEE